MTHLDMYDMRYYSEFCAAFNKTIFAWSQSALEGWMKHYKVGTVFAQHLAW